jgi:uncharacterized damage-inducible protein DinB
MPMTYAFTAIRDDELPAARERAWQHTVDTYASETNKVASVWAAFAGVDLAWTPHARSSSIAAVFKHQLLSERRFFAEFLGVPEPKAGDVLPPEITVETCVQRFVDLARPRITYLAGQTTDWWLARTAFFDVERERIWIFWRRVLHTAHHRTQLTVYLRLLDRTVPATYGPTADVTWEGADPTNTVAAASRSAPPGGSDLIR